MQIRAMLSAVSALGVLMLSGCMHDGARITAAGSSGGGGTGGGGGATTAPVALTVRDSPPSNTTILGFQMPVTSVRLEPGDVALLPVASSLDLTQLQTRTAFLNTANVPLGTYSSVVLTFSIPTVTILNNTGGTITLASTSCANGQVCEFMSNITPMSLTFNLSPSLDLTMAGSSADVELDLDLANLVQSDFSANLSTTNAASLFVFVSSTSGTIPFTFADDVLGVVTHVDTTKNQITLLTDTGIAPVVNIDPVNTIFGFSASCPANNETCLAVNQDVQADLNLNSDGSLTAFDVNFEESPNVTALEGTISSVTSPTQFQMVLNNIAPVASGVAPGSPTTVTILPGATFLVDKQELSLPSGVSFASAADLFAGQEVIIGVTNLSNPLSVSTNRIALNMTQISGPVSTVNTANLTFNMTGLPSIFSAFPSVQVDAVNNTELENLSSFSALVAGDTVSVEGLVFNTTGTIGVPSFVAEFIRNRPFGMVAHRGFTTITGKLR